jgi:glutamate--cysteine ligase
MNDRFSEVEAEAYVASTCFKTGPPRAVGIELEWLLLDAANPVLPISRQRLDAATAADPGLSSGRLTVEPGGQLELSSSPFSDPVTAVTAVTADLMALRTALAAHGLALQGTGLDPARPPRRLLDLPRYTAMERFFDRRSAAGRVMMCSTAAVQVNLDAGPEDPSPAAVDFRTRWAVLHELAPVLVAAFANSPFAGGRPSGERCGRQAVWAQLDPSRTGAARRPDETDPRESWVRYVMSAHVMCIPAEEPIWDAPRGLTFAAWARGGGPRPATLTDLEYHLTTLFPPVRARGHLELRMIDAQRTDADWAAALALVWALITDPRAADAARAALEPLAGVTGLDRRAVVHGMADAALARAARACFAAAAPALDRLGASGLRPTLESFAARYPERGRCPADDALEHWQRTGSVHPPGFGVAAASTRRAAGCPAPTI